MYQYYNMHTHLSIRNSFSKPMMVGLLCMALLLDPLINYSLKTSRNIVMRTSKSTGILLLTTRTQILCSNLALVWFDGVMKTQLMISTFFYFWGVGIVIPNRPSIRFKLLSPFLHIWNFRNIVCCTSHLNKSLIAQCVKCN